MLKKFPVNILNCRSILLFSDAGAKEVERYEVEMRMSIRQGDSSEIALYMCMNCANYLELLAILSNNFPLII